MQHAAVTIDYPHPPRTERPCTPDNSADHRLMDLQQIPFRIRIHSSQELVRRMSTANFLDFTFRSRNSLAVQHRRNLLLGERIAFNGRRTANGTNMVDLTKQNSIWPFKSQTESLRRSRDFRDERNGTFT